MGKSSRKPRKAKADYSSVDTSPRTSAYAIHGPLAGAGNHVVEHDYLASPTPSDVNLETHHESECSALGALSYLMLSSMGICAVIMPYAISLGGFLSSLVLIVILASISYYATYTLAHLASALRLTSHFELMKQAFGRPGVICLGILQLITSFGIILTGVMILQRDFPILLARVLGIDMDENGVPLHKAGKLAFITKIIANRFWFSELLIIALVLPMCLLFRTYRRLQVLAGVGVLLLVVFAVALISKSGELHDKNAPVASKGFTEDYLAVRVTVLHTLSITGTSFSNQRHAMALFNVLPHQSLVSFARVSLMAMFGSLFFACGIGVAGYASFLSSVKPDFLENFYWSQPNQVARPFVLLLLPLCALCCLPLEVMAVCRSIHLMKNHRNATKEDVLFRSQPSFEEQSHNAAIAVIMGSKGLQHRSQHASWSWSLHLAMAVGVLVMALLCSYRTGDIADVLRGTGTSSALLLLCVVPAACQWKLSHELSEQGSWLHSNA